MLRLKKEKELEQEICPEDASFWVKFRNEPYLLTHRKMRLAAYACELVKDYISLLFVIFVVGYLLTSLIAALKVM